jgi:hypothetical protein
MAARALPVTQMRTSEGGGTGLPAAAAERRAAAAERSCIASGSGIERRVERSVHVIAGRGAAAAGGSAEDVGTSARMNLAACSWRGSMPRQTSRATWT